MNIKEGEMQLENKEDYFEMQESILIPMADGTTRPISTLSLGDLVIDKNENECIVVNILRGLEEVEKSSNEVCEEPVYTLILEKDRRSDAKEK